MNLNDIKYKIRNFVMSASSEIEQIIESIYTFESFLLKPVYLVKSVTNQLKINCIDQMHKQQMSQPSLYF